MAKSIKEAYESFIKDVEANFKNKEDIEYLKKRMGSFIDVIEEQLDLLDKKLKKELKRIEEVEQLQDVHDKQIEKMQKLLDNIENDIYSEDGFDFEIVCPYCNNEFIVDMDESKTEILCPKCNNVIELDWSGDPDNDLLGGCNGSCGGCSGCEDEEEDM